MRAQGGSLKVALYLFDGLFILQINNTCNYHLGATVGDNALFTAHGNDHECSVVTSFSTH